MGRANANSTAAWELLWLFLSAPGAGQEGYFLKEFGIFTHPEMIQKYC